MSNRANFFKFTIYRANNIAKRKHKIETLMPALIIMPSMIAGFISALINELKPAAIRKYRPKDGENLSEVSDR